MNAAPQPDLVYDVGAHRGEDSDFYLKAGYRVVAIEANPVLADALRVRFADHIAQGRFTLVERAIAERPGRITFYINDKVSEWGTVEASWAERNERYGSPSKTIEVEAVTFDSVLAEHGCPLYCKIDVEGVDLLCVAALERAGFRAPFLSMETAATSWRTIRKEFAALRAAGYDRFKIVDQSRLPQGGRYASHGGGSIAHDFPFGSSGPFGDEVAGPWLTEQQVLKEFRRSYVIYAILGNHPRLQRFLYTIPLVRRINRIATWHDIHAKHATAG